MPPLTCPRCGMTSHNPQDALEGFCGACCAWTARGSAAAVTDALESMRGYHERPAQIASGSLTWDRPDSDPIADIRQARGLMERYAANYPDPDCTLADVLEALHGASLSATAGVSAELTPEQYEVVRQAMGQWDRARELADGRARTRQVLDDAEKLIARLDGEGYGVVVKARQIEAAEGTTPPEYLDANHAMSWRPGDPGL